LALIASGLESDVDLEQALTRLRNHPVADEALAVAKQWAADAVTALTPLPNSSVKSALEKFAEAVVDRQN
jgi:heptaprenyl diphosphate synthase